MLSKDDIGKVFSFKDVPKHQKRLVEIDKNQIYLIDMDESAVGVPIRIDASTLEEALKNDEIIWFREEVKESYPELNRNEEELARKRWESIGLKWRDPEVRKQFLNRSQRGKLVKKISQELNIGVRQTRSLLAKFWRGGMTRDSLIPQRKGFKKGTGVKNGRIARKGRGIPVTRDVEALFEKAYQQYHLKEGKSIDKTYTYLLRDYYCIRYEEDGMVTYTFKDEDKTPTIGQFRYWISNYRNQEDELRSFYGDQEFENSYAILQSSTLESVKGVGIRAELDATHLPIELVSEKDRSVVVGTPLLELLVDVYSKIVMGFHLTLENESYLTGALTILNAIEDKKDYAERQGVSITDSDWPVHHVPHIILSDNGPFNSRYTDLMEEKFNCYIENATARKGSAKGNVERKNRTFEDYIKDSLPGSAKVIQKGRGAKDPADNACLTLSELRRLIIKKIVEFNHSIINGYPLTPEQINSGIAATPLELWQYSVDRATDELIYLKDLESAKKILLPQIQGKRVIRREGIHAFNFTYTSKDPTVHNWMLNHLKDKVKVAYDPQDISQIFVIDEDQIITLDLNPVYKDYQGMSKKEIKQYQKQNHENQKKQQDQSRLKKLETVDLEEEITQKAKSESRKTKNKKDKKGNRREEIDYQRKKEKEHLQTESDDSITQEADEKDKLRSALFQEKVNEVISKRRDKNESL